MGDSRGGKSVADGWVGDPRECRDRDAVAEHEGVRLANEALASVSEAEVAAFGETLIFGGLAPRIAGSTHPKGSKVAAFMLNQMKTTAWRVEQATAGHCSSATTSDKAMDEARGLLPRPTQAGAARRIQNVGRCGETRRFLGGQARTCQILILEAPYTRSKPCSTRGLLTRTRR